MNALPIKVLRSKQIICDDRSHCHNSPIQNMYTVEINSHTVEITQDGERYNVRVDGGPAVYNLTHDQADQFIKDKT